ncbi:SRPBCC family protein [Nocardioides sp. SYSU DS0663]|uniref:SRPBCC family protein n=1 Tax=Nocardioides sp. SYSU DS0663 TaxID=3416445 RepID=UPI003F4B8DAB
MRIRFDVPAEVVFDYLADPRNRPEWQSSLARVEDVVGEPGPGQAWTDVTKPGLKPRMATTTYERPRRWAETGTWGGFSADLVLELAPDGDGCLADVTFDVRGRGVARPAAAVLGLVAPRAVAADLRRAAEVLSAEPGRRGS